MSSATSGTRKTGRGFEPVAVDLEAGWAVQLARLRCFRGLAVDCHRRAELDRPSMLLKNRGRGANLKLMVHRFRPRLSKNA